MAENEETNIELTSKFKDSLNQIFRINDLWNDAHKHARNGEYFKWNWDLDRVWCELAGDLGDARAEDSKAKKRYDKMKSFNKLIASIQEKTKYISGSNPPLYNVLLDKELFLRQLQNELGKGTAFTDADEDTFE